jgi:archaellum component FlaD/FlaE
MSEGEQNIGEKPLEGLELDTELASITQQNLLPRKIVQRIGDRLKEGKIKITKTQLYTLVERIQHMLQTSTAAPKAFEQQTKETPTYIPEEKHILNDSMVQTTDMKKLIEAVERLTQRVRIIEEKRLQGVEGVTGRLIKTREIQTLDAADTLEGDIHPLEHISNDPETIVVIMKWLQYMVERIGKNNLAETLGYYVDIGWITDDVRLDLIDYSKGIIEEPSQTSRPSQLPTRDHLQSLLFIQKLKGVQLDDRFLTKIERDMEKMAKSLEGYQPK